MEFMRSEDILLRDPCILLIPISFPLHQELKSASYELAVQDLHYYVILFSIDSLWWRWRSGCVGTICAKGKHLEKKD
jgi:hypothetical protein